MAEGNRLGEGRQPVKGMLVPKSLLLAEVFQVQPFDQVAEWC
jgi:hypothetical protein